MIPAADRQDTRKSACGVHCQHTWGSCSKTPTPVYSYSGGKIQWLGRHSGGADGNSLIGTVGGLLGFFLSFQHTWHSRSTTFSSHGSMFSTFKYASAPASERSRASQSGEEQLARAGVGDGHAEQLATLLITAMEGGFLLSRATRCSEPMRDVGSAISRLLDFEIGGVA